MLRQAAAPRRLAAPGYLRPGERLDEKPVERGRAPAVRTAVEDGVPAVPVDCAKQWEAEMDDDAIYMGTRELAAFLGLSPRTLDRYRVSGGGPKFHKFGTGCATPAPMSRRGRRNAATARPPTWAAPPRGRRDGRPGCAGSRTSRGAISAGSPVRRGS